MIDTAPLTAALAAVKAAITAAGSPLSEASVQALGAIYVAAINAVALFNTAIAGLDASIDEANPGGVMVAAPVVSAAALLLQQQTFEDEAILINTRAFLIRLAANIAGAIGPAAFAPGTQIAPAPPAQVPQPAAPQPVLNLPFVLDQSLLGGPDVLE